MSTGKTHESVRVCHVLASTGGKGGLEKNVIELANRQRELGHQVAVVADESMRAYFSERINFLPHSMASWRFNPLKLRQLCNRIRESHPQIVHAHANKAGMMVRLLREFLPGVKRVATVQNIKRSGAPFRGYDAIIAASLQVKDSLGEIPAAVIWNSIDPPPIHSRDEARATNPPFLDDREPVFCTVGRLVPAKGIDLLLEAMARVPGFKLWVVGEGEQRGELEAILDRLKLRPRVWMAGHRDDAVGVMGCADLLVISSRNEGGPYTLAEALHMRVPVISTRVGYAPEFLNPETLMETHSVNELESGLKTALTDLEGLRRRLEPSFVMAAREISLEAMTRKVLAVYEEVLSRDETGRY